MKKCLSCNISFNTCDKLCPLCQNKLEGDKNEPYYPNKKSLKSNDNAIILKILLFISLLISLIVGYIEFRLSSKLKYSIYVFISLFTNYIIIKFMFRNFRNILKMFLKYGMVLNTLILIWYFVTKTTIITNYIIPSICLFELIFNLIICLVLQEKYFVKYSNLLFINLFMLFMPAVLVFFDQTTNNIMAHICLISACSFVIALIIFFYDNIKEEVKKYFNL